MSALRVHRTGPKMAGSTPLPTRTRELAASRRPNREANAVPGGTASFTGTSMPTTRTTSPATMKCTVRCRPRSPTSGPSTARSSSSSSRADRSPTASCVAGLSGADSACCLMRSPGSRCARASSASATPAAVLLPLGAGARHAQSPSGGSRRVSLPRPSCDQSRPPPCSMSTQRCATPSLRLDRRSASRQIPRPIQNPSWSWRRPSPNIQSQIPNRSRRPSPSPNPMRPFRQPPRTPCRTR